MTGRLNLEEDRFARFRLLPWWDQEKLRAARILVIGAGGLGNELLKNLALLGAGNLLVADFDRIEKSNLSRTILFRERDEGAPKAEVAARSVRDILPGANVRTFVGDGAYDLGLGAYLWADLVLAGLDGREARVMVNRRAARAGKPWIDGAIEGLAGVARVFAPADGPCYECTMGAADWEMIERRRACSLLTVDELEAGRVPAVPTTASVIAAMQAQEAVKLLHGLETLAGRGFVYNGLTHDSYVVSYPRKPDCYGHERWPDPEPLSAGAATLRAGDLVERARRDLGADAVVELGHDLLFSLECPECGMEEEVFVSPARARAGMGRCGCGAERTPNWSHTLTPDVLDRTLADIGVPKFEVLLARSGDRERAYLLDADEAEVVG